MSATLAPAGLAVVTGASAGIGEAVARELSRRGRPVLAVARRKDRLRALAEEAEAGSYAPIHPLVLDVSADGAPARLAEAARALGGAGWLVNSAGVGAYGHFGAQEPERLTRLLRLNCEAVVLVTRALLPQLRASGEGVLLNVASISAFQPTPFEAVYGASKAFVLAFTESLSAELRGTGVYAGAYCPGPVRTEFADVAGLGDRVDNAIGVLTAEAAALEALAQIARRDVVHVSRLLFQLTTLAMRYLPRALVRRISAINHFEDGGASGSASEEATPPPTPARGRDDTRSDAAAG